MNVVGVDGCAGGWLCVAEEDGALDGFVLASLAQLLERAPHDAVVAIDVPVGLTEVGPRSCDLEARRLLGRPRASSVFPAPVRAALSASTYEQACIRHEEADGRRLSKQAFAILPKIREVDAVLSRAPALQSRVREVHPEVCFAVWNGGHAMQHPKREPAGRKEREALIEVVWPGLRDDLARRLRGTRHEPDDLNDALAALWTAKRIAAGLAVVLPAAPTTDRFGLRMEIVA